MPLFLWWLYLWSYIKRSDWVIRCPTILPILFVIYITMYKQLNVAYEKKNTKNEIKSIKSVVFHCCSFEVLFTLSLQFWDDRLPISSLSHRMLSPAYKQPLQCFISVFLSTVTFSIDSWSRIILLITKTIANSIMVPSTKNNETRRWIDREFKFPSEWLLD